MCLQSIACFFSAESSVAGYTLRHRAQQYSGQKKNSFCPTIPLPRFPPLKAFFSSLHTAVFPSALVQLPIEKANASGQFTVEDPAPKSPLSHVPPAHSRHSLLGCSAPLHSCRLCASVTAHSRMPAHKVLFIDFSTGMPSYRCLCHSSPMLKTRCS